MRQIVLDTETTGLHTSEGHRIIELGCVELINRKFTGARFHHYINPEREIDEGALAIHGITSDFLANKPLFREVAQDFLQFIKGAELIIHNAPFDIGFLDHELALANGEIKSITEHCRIIDTLILARKLHVGQRNSLDALCKRYGIDNTQRELHGAMLDAHLLAQVYLAMTGGQGSLFEHLQTSDSHVVDAAPEIVNGIESRNLTIRKASPDELALHQDYLTQMSEKGKCLWLEVNHDH